MVFVFHDFLKICAGKFSLIYSCSKKRKEGVKSNKKIFLGELRADDFKIVMEVSVDGMSYIIFVSTLHLNRSPCNRFS